MILRGRQRGSFRRSPPGFLHPAGDAEAPQDSVALDAERGAEMMNSTRLTAPLAVLTGLTEFPEQFGIMNHP